MIQRFGLKNDADYNENMTIFDMLICSREVSRGLVPAMDVTLLISDCSRRGIQAAGRIPLYEPP